MDFANLRIISDLKIFLTELPAHPDLWRHSVLSEKAFTRRRSMPFHRLVLMILNLPKRSLNIELHSFFKHVGQPPCGKSAFCMQRAKLKPYFFQVWNRVLVQRFYHHYAKRVKRWKGFILLAFDGSVLSLPNTKELRAVYGNTSNENGQNGVVARACLAYDVLNKLIVESNLVSYFTAERSVVMQQLEYLPADSLLIFDRGYPCFWLFYLFLKKNHNFVMRLSLDFNKVVKAFVASPKQDCVVDFHPSWKSIKQIKLINMTISEQTSVKIRLVKFQLKTGETEVLATSLYSKKQFAVEDLKEVYFKRWGIETCFGILKNQLQIENFSGIRGICVEQDFFANLFVYNLQSIIEKQCVSTVAAHSGKKKYTYQINKNVSWALLKERMVDLFLKKNPKQILLELQALFERYLQPVKPNRSIIRKQKAIHGNMKYTTLMNYKRAI